MTLGTIGLARICSNLANSIEFGVTGQLGARQDAAGNMR
jgi:hypothetical protein